jgi:hypothetical protein
MANRRRSVTQDSLFDRYYAVWMTLVAMMGVAASFAAGLKMGYRSARVVAMQQVLPDPLAQLDAEKEQYRALTFHTALTSSKKPSAFSPPASPSNEGAEKLRAMWMASGAQKGECVLQLGVFDTWDEAQVRKTGWEKKGFRPVVREVLAQGKNALYRVQIGRFPSETWAAKAKNVLMQQGMESTPLCVP